MELRHLRYFIAVAAEGSITNAAERRLHTAQPSLSPKIRGRRPPAAREIPTIELVMGYNKSNTSPLLKRFLLRADELVNRVEAYSRGLKRGDRKPSV